MGSNLINSRKSVDGQRLFYRKDVTKPHKAGKREIEIDLEAPKITETFMPNDLEDMSLQRKVQ